jgi:hypothetical protein
METMETFKALFSNLFKERLKNKTAKEGVILWSGTILSVGLCVLGGVINLSRQYFGWSLWLNPLSLLLIVMGVIVCLANIAIYSSVDDSDNQN